MRGYLSPSSVHPSTHGTQPTSNYIPYFEFVSQSKCIKKNFPILGIILHIDLHFY